MSSFSSFNKNTDSANDTTMTVTLTSVPAGALLVVGVKYEGATTTSSVTNNLGDTFVAKTEKRHANDAFAVRMFYCLASAGSGSTVTFTLTLGANRDFKAMHAMAFTYSGTAAFEAEPSGGGGSGTSNAPASGNITTTGTDIISVAMYGSFGAVTNGWQINGVNADAHQEDSLDDSSWYRLVTSGYTGQASGSTLSSAEWILNLASFKVTASGGNTQTPSGFGLTTNLGAPTLANSGVQVSPSGFGLTISRGTPTVSAGIQLSPSGFGLTTALGTMTTQNDITLTGVSGYGLAVSLGTPSISTGSSVTLTPTGYGLTISRGTPTVITDDIESVAGYSLAVALGTPTLTGQDEQLARGGNSRIGPGIGVR